MKEYHQQLELARKTIGDLIAAHQISLDDKLIESILLNDGFVMGHRFERDDVVADFNAQTDVLELRVNGKIIESVKITALPTDANHPTRKAA